MAPVADKLYHPPKIMDRTKVQINTNANGQSSPASRTTYGTKKENTEKPWLRVVYILDSITMQDLTIHSNQQDQIHSSSVYELKSNTCSHQHTRQTSSKLTDRLTEQKNT